MDIGLLAQGEKAYGAFILTASHNAGGPHEVNTLYQFSTAQNGRMAYKAFLSMKCEFRNTMCDAKCLTWNKRITCLAITDFLLAFPFYSCKYANMRIG